ncbi:MAG: hypothetical protein RLY14_2508 [Planctomycetota bacterium]|jgi:ethanolamine utilization protein EutN
MHLYKTLGYVTLNRSHPALRGGRFVLAHSINHELLGQPTPEDQDLLVVWDDLGASPGTTIAVSDGAEAAQAFKPEIKPVDAYNAAILDSVEIDSASLKKLQ